MPRPVYALLLLMMLPWAAGCNVIGVAATVVSPPELVRAKYELPDKTTLIVIDDRNGLINNEATLRRIASSVRAALEAEEVVTMGFVSQDELSRYREELGDSYEKTSLAALGLHLDAKQVIHAEVTGYQMSIGGDVIRPTMGLNVKVFDLDELTRVFPPAVDPATGVDSGETVFPIETKMKAQDLSGQGAARSIAARDLADMAGRDIARLFFDWRRPQPGADLGNKNK